MRNFRHIFNNFRGDEVGKMHGNISIFIPHVGCPNACSFCDQRTISGERSAPSAAQVRQVLCEAHRLGCERGSLGDTQIAFFGGSFTAIDRGYMISLLEAAGEFLGKSSSEGFSGIRISTRPDCIDEEILGILKSYGVTAIELGAQSMSDDVLAANGRGHSSGDVFAACEMIRSHGFELGVQMMVGLYMSRREDEIFTCEQLIKCCPDTVRIYPVAVLRGTELERLYLSGEFVLYPFEECVEICADISGRFARAGVRVIRMGLHAEDGVRENAVAGFYHPAFGEIVASFKVREIIRENLREGVNICEAHSSFMSALSGHKKCNRKFFEGLLPGRVVFRCNDDIARGCVAVNGVSFEVV